MNYPKRGCMSEDGKYYTHTDGSVHERQLNTVGCASCSLMNLTCGLCNDALTVHPWKQVSGAYVPTDEEREACEAMRAGIVRCSLNGTGFEGCKSVIAPCHLLTAKTCPLRAYLDSKKQPDAWEGKP